MVNLSAFVARTDLLKQSEIDRVRLLVFFHMLVDEKSEFTTRDVTEWLSALHLPEPNQSRLLKSVRASKNFVRGETERSFKLSAVALQKLRGEHPDILDKTEEIYSGHHVLPDTLYKGTRGYIESLSRQINASYEQNIFDGCAVLMRRLLEVLLILSYQHLGIDALIRDAGGNYIMLERIIADAKGNGTLNLSRNSKQTIDEFRIIGNFSAHKIYYNARREDIRRLLTEYRALIEELLYKSGIRT